MAGLTKGMLPKSRGRTPSSGALETDRTRSAKREIDTKDIELPEQVAMMERRVSKTQGSHAQFMDGLGVKYGKGEFREGQ